MPKITRIHFEDWGQDFLWWDIDPEGNVVDCGPFQASVWVGCKIDLPVEEFTYPYFETPRGEYLQLNYAIYELEEREVPNA